MILIIDYGMGNVGSIANMFRRLAIPAVISSDLNQIGAAERLLLPGVGAFDQGMENLEKSGIRQVLDRRVLEDRVPVMGICLGMQLMTRSSEEGSREGLGWVDAETVHFSKGAPDSTKGLKLPHIGWNFVYSHADNPLLADLPADPRFYFVHSYKVRCASNVDVLLRTSYGGVEFTSAFQHSNVAGFQFHPEKSHRYGMQLLTNFARWNPSAPGAAHD